MKDYSRFSFKQLIKKGLNSNPNKNKYWNIIRELRLWQKEKIESKLITILNEDKNIQKRLFVINLLAQFGESKKRILSKHKDIFIHVLENEKNKVLIEACLIALGHNNYDLSKNDIRTITSFRKSKDRKIRYGVVFALLSVESNKAIDTLILLSKDKCKYVRDWATFGLGSQIEKNSPKIRKSLWKGVHDKDLHVRHEAMKGLSQRKDKRILPILHKDLKKGKFDSIILESVEEIGNLKTYKILKKKVKKIKSRNNKENNGLITDLNYCLRNLKINLS